MGVAALGVAAEAGTWLGFQSPGMLALKSGKRALDVCKHTDALQQFQIAQAAKASDETALQFVDVQSYIARVQQLEAEVGEAHLWREDGVRADDDVDVARRDRLADRRRLGGLALDEGGQQLDAHVGHARDERPVCAST